MLSKTALDKHKIGISQPTNVAGCIIPLFLARAEDLTWHLCLSVRQAGLTLLFWYICPSLASLLEERCRVFNSIACSPPRYCGSMWLERVGTPPPLSVCVCTCTHVYTYVSMCSRAHACPGAIWQACADQRTTCSFCFPPCRFWEWHSGCHG